MMFELYSKRLRLIPLNANYLQLLIEHENDLAIEFSLHKLEGIIDDELKQALDYRRSKVLEDEENYIWHTNWLIVCKEQNCARGHYAKRDAK